jgi:hypothetical protein
MKNRASILRKGKQDYTKTTLVSIERLTRNRFRPQKSRPPPQKSCGILSYGLFLHFNQKFGLLF